MEPSGSEGFMGSVLSKLSGLVELEFSWPWDTDGLIRTVTGDLWRFRAYYSYLSDANIFVPRRPILSSAECAIQIMVLFYRADNAVDSILVHTRTAANQEEFDRLFMKVKPSLDLLARVSEDADVQLIRVVRLFGEHGFRYKERPAELVGIENPRDVLINMLAQGDGMSEPKKQMKIVSIVGIAGIGKTDLARVVYNQIKPEYECAAFVSAPFFPSMNRFFRELMFQLDGDNGVKFNQGAMDNERLISHVGTFLQNKRYLVVIDDLWDDNDWQIISASLPNNDCGSRVVAITRFNHIANLCCSRDYELVYEIQRLGYPDSKKMFVNELYVHKDSCPDGLTDFNEILKMCGGTPSGIISTARLISSKMACQEKMNSVHVNWKQPSSSILHFADWKDILLLIYRHVPSTLKDCLLYLVVQSKNQMIHRTTMVSKWIAEGFISEFGCCSREELASRYFDELIDRNFIQLVEYGNSVGDEIYETNHLMLHALKLISHEVNFATIWHDDKISMEYTNSIRLSIQCSDPELSVHTKAMNSYLIRSISIIGPAKFYLTDVLPFLRVLDLDGCKDLNMSAMYNICNMTLLKYLSLKHTQVTMIPAEISQLRCLETLNIRQTGISYLPPQIKYLQELKTLDASRTEISCIPPEIGELQNLETLDTSHTRISNLPREIGKLQELKTLDASHTEIICIPPEIGELQNLETLDASHTRISNLPPEIGKLQALKTLDVRQTHIEELPKKIVQLPKLAHLYFGQISSSRGVKLPAGIDQLKSVEALGTVDSREWSASAMEEISGLTGVRGIEVVLHDQSAEHHDHRLFSSIGECKNLEYLIIHGDHNPSDDLPVSSKFSRLERLKVTGRFMKVPQWIAHLSSLKKLDVRVCKLDQDDLKILGSLPVLSTLALELICIPWKKEVAITNWLKSSTSTDPSPTEESSHTGFMSLEVFSFDSRVPWITFEQGAMPRLNQLHLKLYACPGDKFPSGLNNIDSLEKIILQYPSVYASSSGVTKVVAAIREGASSHRNLIDLSVNGYHEVFPSNTTVDQGLIVSEIEESSNHGKPIELSINADHEVLPSNAMVDKAITSTGIEEDSNRGNPIELSVNADHDVLLSNPRIAETISGTEIKECY